MDLVFTVCFACLFLVRFGVVCLRCVLDFVCWVGVVYLFGLGLIILNECGLLFPWFSVIGL